MPCVLLVESDANLRALAGSLIEAGFDLAYEGGGDEALERLAFYVPDVIVLGALAGAPQPALTARLRVRAPRARILDVAPDAGVRAAGGGADARLAPPFDASSLVGAIWRLIEQRTAGPAP